MASKRRRPAELDADALEATTDSCPPAKRLRSSPPASRLLETGGTGEDLLSPLSDELLLRILSFLPLHHLLTVSPVSRRFYRLASDSQLWKALYYTRFVLPRAMRIPGFRGMYSGSATSGRRHKLHYSGRRNLWADGRRGGVVREAVDAPRENETNTDAGGSAVNWKRQYKIRHNWARGKCAVEELRLGENFAAEEEAGRKMLVKVVEGVAVTADRASGLRAWDLKSRELIAQISLGTAGPATAPSCMAVDDQNLADNASDVAIGFADGSFGVWRLDLGDRRLIRRYRHEKSSNGELAGIAFSHPYLMTATEAVLISLYTFQGSGEKGSGESQQELESETERGSDSETERGREDSEAEDTWLNAVADQDGPGKATDVITLPAPYLLTSLRSHTAPSPLALSVRKTATAAIASVAYTFSSRQGWSIGIQDLHVQTASAGLKSPKDVTATRLAYTAPVSTGYRTAPPSSPPSTPPRRGFSSASPQSPPAARSPPASAGPEPGPTALCYTHPYLLATLPDNTLILHLCTSTASSLSISPGIRLWGHTSGISDAEITARGKAVSVSSRGEEMRVWELEGRSASTWSRSVEIRPEMGDNRADEDADTASSTGDGQRVRLPDWDERRNWVGFDDEMVIVLKEAKGGRESLMVYDFTM